MAIYVNTNSAANNTQGALDKASKNIGGTFQRLSSGLRINSAKDDAAGQAISTRFTAQIRGLEQARRNANDAISLSQVAEGALDQQTQMLQRVRELAVQSATGSNSTSDRQAIDAEVQQLKSELTRVANVTSFNGIEILNGNFASGKSFHVGSQSAAEGNQVISFAVADMRAGAIGAGSSFSVEGDQISKVDANAGELNAANTTLAVQAGGGNVATLTTAVDASVKALADGINGQTSLVTASAETTMDITFGQTSGALNLDIGASVTGLASAAATHKIDISEFNSSSVNDMQGLADQLQASLGDAFGVAVDGQKLTVTASQGHNLSVTNNSAEDITVNTATVAQNSKSDIRGELKIQSASGGVGVTGAGDGTTAAGAAGNALGLAIASGIHSGEASSQTVGGIDVKTQENANEAISVVDKAIATINDTRANLGAVQNRFEATVSGLATTTENLYASRSRILDADFAKETADLAKNSILQQASTAMLAQANQSGQLALQLLG